MLAGEDVPLRPVAVPTPQAPRKVRVFVVESDRRKALRLEDLLRREGCEPVATAHSVEGSFAALDALKDKGIVPDAALVDAELRDEPPHRIIIALEARGIPVLVGTCGPDGDGAVPCRRGDYIGSFFGTGILRAALRAVAGGGGGRAERPGLSSIDRRPGAR